MNDDDPDLSRSLAQLGLFIGVHGFFLAGVADGTVAVHKAIEQALVAGVPVAMAVAWLLVKHGLHLGCQRIDVLRLRIGEHLRITSF